MKKTLLGLVSVSAMFVAGTALAEDNKVTLQLKWVHAGAVRGLFRREGQGLLQGRGSRRHDQGGRAGHRARAGDRRRRRGRDRRLDAGRARRAREGRAARQHRPAVQAFGTWSSPAAPTRASRSPQDLKGRTLGVWFYGNEYPFLNWMGKLKLPTDGSPDGVKVLKQGFNVDPLMQKQADCISTMTYNEYWQVHRRRLQAEPARRLQI